MKRFYKTVAVSKNGDGYIVLLDGKPVKTPARVPLVVPTRALAEAIAAEWRDQGEDLDPNQMPLTRIVNTAIDRVPHHRSAVAGEVMSFGNTDLLCYRADTAADLADRQSAAWDPLLEWLAERHHARLSVTRGVNFVQQPGEAVMALEKNVWSRDDFALAALQMSASLTGSLVLALALADGRLTADEAFAIAHLDEDYQAEKWGRDSEAEARLAARRADLAAAERVFRALMV